MQAAALATEEAALDRLAGEVVVEAEHVGVGLHEQAAVDRRPQVVDERRPRRGAVTAASRSKATRRPSTEAADTTARTSGSRPSSWLRTASATVQGSGASGELVVARGRRRWRPAPRGRTGCRRCGCGARRRRGRAGRARTPRRGTSFTSAGLRRPSCRCVTVCRRSSRGRRSAAGWRRDRPSGR